MDNEVKKNNGAETEQPLEPDEIKPAEEGKKDEAKKVKKEFILFRAIKATGRGIMKTGRAINGFVHEHPWGSVILSSGIAVGIVKGFEALTGSDSDVDLPEPTMSLPESTDDEPTVFPDDEPVEIPEVSSSDE